MLKLCYSIFMKNFEIPQGLVPIEPAESETTLDSEHVDGVLDPTTLDALTTPELHSREILTPVMRQLGRIGNSFLDSVVGLGLNPLHGHWSGIGLRDDNTASL
jgi:hypothetical protein